MIAAFDTSTLHRFDQATRHEWLETNGIGGYASSTVIGANTRRYHGLLVAATQAPVGREVVLAKLDEALLLHDTRLDLGSNKYTGAVYPDGYIFLQRMEKELFPTFVYQAQGITLQKTIAAVHGENTTLIRYEVLEAPGPFGMELLPLIAGRDFHSLGRRNNQIQPFARFDNGHFYYKPYPHRAALHLQIDGAHYTQQPDWYYNLEYQVELYRGQDAHEDLFSPGKFYVTLHPGQVLTLIASTEPVYGRNGDALLARERVRREALMVQAAASDEIERQLVLAADQFIVRRGESGKSILAGYPWFADWGRDTMIALPGLCLATGREHEARGILQLFAQNTDQGMLPNRFPDQGSTPLYNTIDATLWFFVAAWKYYHATGDLEFIRTELLPVMRDILEWHDRGTRYNIRTDHDGLLTGGAEGVQLTWMDAKVGDWVVTPRRGKAVEVNALWYNAWEIMGHFARLCGLGGEADTALGRAAHIRVQFGREFWNEAEGCLFDYLGEGYKDPAVRPNQIFALSLPFPVLDADKAHLVLHRVEQDLLTIRGLRSLSPDHPSFSRKYGGSQYYRDAAYHQGTVWGWLIGPYIDALVRYRGEWGRQIGRELLHEFSHHLGEAGIGSVSEIFDGDAPFHPRGCYAQAWSVGELLRVNFEYQLTRQTPIRQAEQGRKAVVSAGHGRQAHPAPAMTLKAVPSRVPQPR